jgi:hypothetical protein
MSTTGTVVYQNGKPAYISNNGVNTTVTSDPNVSAASPAPVVQTPGTYSGVNTQTGVATNYVNGAPVAATPAGGSGTATNAQPATTATSTTLDPNTPVGGTYLGAAPTTPLTEDQIYQNLLSQNAGVIDSINKNFDDQVNTAETTGQQAGAGAQAQAAAQGLMGTESAATSTNNSQNTNKNVQGINATRSTQITSALQTIQQNAQTQANTDQTNFDNESQQYFQNAQTIKTSAIASVQAMGAAEVNWSAFQQTPEYSQLVQQLGGDPNYADALYTLSKPQGVVDTNLSKVIGNTYYQVTKDPVTGAMSSSSFQVPYDVPKNWTFQKIGTNAGIFYDPTTYNPADPSTYKSVYTDPFTGAVTDGAVSSGTTGAGTASDDTPTTAEYGLLANVSGFDPTQPVDSAAVNYLNEYLYQGKTPTAASVGISTRSGSGAEFNSVAERANDLYTQATGQALPIQSTVEANQALISGNNSILNTLNNQEGVISANADLLLTNLNGNNLNQNVPLINGIIDGIKAGLGNVDVSTFQTQNATIANELGSLLALKNATGTTVHDKLESAGIIQPNDSADQIAAKIKILMKEAQNGRAALEQSNTALMATADPLQKLSSSQTTIGSADGSDSSSGSGGLYDF